MDISAIISAVIPLVAVLGWIYMLHKRELESRRLLGAGVVEVRLHRRWSIVAQTAGLIAAVATPLLALYMAYLQELYPEEIAIEMTRALSAASFAYALRRSGRVFIGGNGLALGANEMIAWSDIRSIRWDRDIGQRLWGVTIEVRLNDRTDKRRIYVGRALKPSVEGLLEGYILTTSPTSQTPSLPSPDLLPH